MTVSYSSLTSWEKPIYSGVAVFSVNLGYAIMYIFELSIVTLLAYSTLIGLTLTAAGVYGVQCLGVETPCCLNAEKSNPCIEKAANSAKEAYELVLRYVVKVFTWQCTKLSIAVGAIAYLLLYVSDYISLPCLALLKIDFDFLTGAFKKEIDKHVKPQLEKLTGMATQAIEKIPRAAAVKKGD